MTWAEKFTAAQKPEMADVAAWIDMPLWAELRGWIEQTYQTEPAVEYSGCSGMPGWNVKYRKGSRPVCVIYPQEGYLICMVSIAARLIPELEGLLPTYSREFQDLYARSGSFMGGKWLMVEVREAEQAEDVKRLMLLRVKPVRKRPD